MGNVFDHLCGVAGGSSSTSLSLSVVDVLHYVKWRGLRTCLLLGTRRHESVRHTTAAYIEIHRKCFTPPCMIENVAHRIQGPMKRMLRNSAQSSCSVSTIMRCKRVQLLKISRLPHMLHNPLVGGPDKLYVFFFLVAGNK
jgi:hypothetical protein